MKIVFLDAETLGTDISLEPISSLGEYTAYDRTSPAEVHSRMAGCDVVITNKVRIGKEEIDGCPTLKLICEAATGTNNIDVAYAESVGIPVRNVAAYSTESVVQTTFMHLLNLIGKADYFDAAIKSGDYSHSGCFTDVSRVFYELDGKKMAILGLGNIGSRVASVAKAFGMEVAYFSTSGTKHSSEYPAMELDEILAWADVLSVHAPLNPRTANLITYDCLCKMKPSAFVINMGRGGIVNEADLARAIDEGVIAGGALDVFEKEPIPADHPYLAMKRKENLRLTPHIGWASQEARIRLVAGIARNIREVMGI